MKDQELRLPLYESWLEFLAGTDAPWCVIVAQPGKEKAVQAELSLAGWETYLPMQTVWLNPTRARRKAKRPLLARYFFAACIAGDVAAPSQIDGLVKTHWPPALDPRAPSRFRSAVRLDLLARLMLTEARHGFDETYRRPHKAKKGGLVCGQEITIRAGVFAGIEALILRVLSEREVVAQLPAPICGTDEVVVASADVELIEPQVDGVPVAAAA
jgi:transcription antitermination factor NusG